MYARLNSLVLFIWVQNKEDMCVYFLYMPLLGFWDVHWQLYLDSFWVKLLTEEGFTADYRKVINCLMFVQFC